MLLPMDCHNTVHYQTIPGHDVIRHENSERIVKLSFAEDLQVRFCITSGKDEFFFQRNQPLIDREDLAQTLGITIFVMTGSIVWKVVIENFYTQLIDLNPCHQMTFLILTLRTLSSFRVIIGHLLGF